MKNWLTIVIFLFAAALCQSATISGFVIDTDNGERIPYATVAIEGTNQGSITNKEGYFVINQVKVGKHRIMVSHISYGQLFVEKEIKKVNDEIFFKAELEKSAVELEEVEVTESKYKFEINKREISVGTIRQSTEEILDVAQLADADVFRAIQVLPGVTSISDFSSGLYVRGGSPDQNLILLDEIDVYNPNHFGGIFSTFNTDAVENVELLKGGFPAKYGGRLSSVLNVTNLDGNRKHHEGIARISMISSNATLQGPWKIGKESGSYMASFRRTYLELLQSLFDIPDYYFYDGHAKMTWDINEKDKVSTSVYFGKDNLKLDIGSDLLISWGNETFTTQWVHIFNPQLFSHFVFAGSHFGSLFEIDTDGDFYLERENDINDLTVKGILSYNPNNRHLMDFGFESKYNDISFVYFEESNADPNRFPNIDVTSFTNTLWYQDNWDWNILWTFQYGVRLTHCYSRSEYLAGEPSENFYRISPRASLRYKTSLYSNIYINYGRYYQYLTSLNPGESTPFDLWFPIDSSVEPGVSDHFIFGYKSQFSNNFAVDTEAYFKTYDNLVEYRPEVDYEWNNETGTLSDVYNQGKGHSYGVDLMLRNDWRGLEGFIGYSFGITERKIDNVNINPETGDEEYFHPTYERNHQVNVVETYNLTQNTGRTILGSECKIGLTYTYGSGQPSSEPEQMYIDETGIQYLYGYKDKVRLPGYSRTDLAFKFKWQHSAWSIEPYLQIYNIFNHHNVWFRNHLPYIDEDTGDVKIIIEDTYMFPRIPFLGVNIEW